MISPSDRSQAVELIEEAVQNGASLAAACRETGISERTYKRWKAQSVTENSHIDRRTTCERPVPANKLSELEERQILNIAHSEKYASMPPSQIVPSLADEGIYIASESTFYRVLHKYNEQHHRGRSQTPTTRPITTHTATAPNQVYVWDITYLNGPIKGAHYYLYMISDIFSRKIIAWEVWKEESAEHASELIRRSYIAEKLALNEHPLVLHSDNGSPMKGATMLETLYALGIMPSNSRPRVSNDNAYAESLFKTVKYRPDYQPKGFATLDEARQWVHQFVEWYNNEHHHSGINFLTPAQRHSVDHGLDVLEKRKVTYELAKAAHPERWSKQTRDWSIEATVFLNPDKVEKEKEVKEEKVS